MRQIYALQLVTAPADAIVDIDEAKQWLKIDPSQTQDDGLIESLVKALTANMEAEYNEAFIKQTWKLFLDWFPCFGDSYFWARSAIELPKPPAIAVTHLKYYDPDDVLQTLATPADYAIDLASRPARIVPAYGKYWPITRCKPNAIEIQFDCGYIDADGKANVPEEIKRELQVRLAHAYENRGIVEMPPNSVVGLWPERHINV
jgi:uncharacterized phiE125 gp8 family phage protein